MPIFNVITINETHIGKVLSQRNEDFIPNNVVAINTITTHNLERPLSYLKWVNHIKLLCSQIKHSSSSIQRI